MKELQGQSQTQERELKVAKTTTEILQRRIEELEEQNADLNQELLMLQQEMAGDV